MSKFATGAARANVAKFLVDERERLSLHIYLSEMPGGDEFGLLKPEDRELGARFVRWCADHDITVWQDDED